MKIKKTKLQKKSLQFYAVNFDVRAPYRVLAEPGFLQTAIDNKVFLREDLPKLLHDTAFLVVTNCIVHELSEKGENYSGSSIMAKRLFREKCSHEEAVSSQQCIKDMISGGFKCIVGVQSEEFKKELRNIPGVPVVTISERNHNLVLEAPSKATQQQADKLLHYKSLRISPEEAAMIEEARKELAQDQPALPSKKRQRPPLKKKKSKKDDQQYATPNETEVDHKKKTRRKKKKKTDGQNNHNNTGQPNNE